MTTRMFRYLVPVDGKAYAFDLDHNPVHVAYRFEATAGECVEFWAEHSDGDHDRGPRTFQVFGTGHPLPDGARWIGTCDRTPDGLVWHLYEVHGAA